MDSDAPVEQKILEYMNRSDKNTEIETAKRKLNGNYPNLLRKLLEEGLGRRSDNLKALAAYLGNLATVAAFLAGVQIGFIQFTAGNTSFPSGFQPKPSSAGAAVTNVFSFIAISLDALGAVFAFVFADILLKRATEAGEILQKKTAMTNQLYKITQNSETKLETEAHSLAGTITSYSTDAGQLLRQVDKFCTNDKTLRTASYIPITVVAIGMLFFFGSLFMFLCTTQIAWVWAPVVVTAGAIAAVLVYCTFKLNRAM